MNNEEEDGGSPLEPQPMANFKVVISGEKQGFDGCREAKSPEEGGTFVPGIVEKVQN